jgi:hypothetical protein
MGFEPVVDELVEIIDALFAEAAMEGAQADGAGFVLMRGSGVFVGGNRVGGRDAVNFAFVGIKGGRRVIIAVQSQRGFIQCRPMRRGHHGLGTDSLSVHRLPMHRLPMHRLSVYWLCGHRRGGDSARLGSLRIHRGSLTESRTCLIHIFLTFCRDFEI